MQTWIALFRGINVGGKNILPMAKLKAVLQSLNCSEIRTYIQSGNAVFCAAGSKAAPLTKKIRIGVKDQQGFEPQVVLLTPSELQAAINSNPFPTATTDPKALHFFFLAEPAASPNLELLDQAKAASENYVLTDRVFYLHTPDGIGRSKLAASAEKHLGVVATARNYRTVMKLKTMVG